MPEKSIDCRGLSCPEPLIRTRDFLAAKRPTELTVLVDNRASLENVSRFLTSQGFTVATEGRDGIFHLRAERQSGDIPTPELNVDDYNCDMPAGETLVVIASAVVGSGDDGLGTRLMKNFVATLPEMGRELWRVILLNGGVTLAAEPSPVLADLQKLEASGVGVFVCGTCLEHFGLTEKKAVRQTTNMLDVITGMQVADKVIRI